jgi:hypothetical protein
VSLPYETATSGDRALAELARSSTAVGGTMPALNAPDQENNGDWLRPDELSNAIDNLEMCGHFLATLPHPVRWKWGILALHQAIYGFAICAVKGTDACRFFSAEGGPGSFQSGRH